MYDNLINKSAKLTLKYNTLYLRDIIRYWYFCTSISVILLGHDEEGHTCGCNTFTIYLLCYLNFTSHIIYCKILLIFLVFCWNKKNSLEKLLELKLKHFEAPIWNWICFFILFQLTRLLKFTEHESFITYVIVNAVNKNKNIQSQLGSLPVVRIKKSYTENLLPRN